MSDVDILRGIRVLEVGQVLSAPFSGAIFADLGAEVVKIERVDGGDDGRRMGKPFRYGDSINFQIFNRGKKSVALDLKSVEGKAVFEQLVAEADILVHNLRPGVVEEMEIDSASLCARHPRLIYCEISAFGHVGPMRMRPGYEPLVQAYSGLSSSNGGPDDPPIRIGASVCDMGTGMWCAIGALALLQRRSITGHGGVVNASLLETALVWNIQRMDSLQNEGRLLPRHASGHPGYVPYEAFDAADGPLIICCGNDRLFAKLSQELGRPEWINDPRYATNRARLDNKNSLVTMLRAILRGGKRDDWIARFLKVSVPCAPILTVPEVVKEPQVTALDLFQAIPGEDFGLTALPLSFDGARPKVTRRAPQLGEHDMEFEIGRRHP